MSQKIFFWISIYLIMVIGILGLAFDSNMTAMAQSETHSALIAPTPGLKAFGQPESYTPDTLWEKINGQAEFYLPAGFELLKSQLYVAIDNAGMFIEVNIYDMGNLANAFSVFSLQQRDNARSINVTPMAYHTENAVYLAHGPYYVEIISMVPLGTRITMLNQLALQFVQDTPVQTAGMHELSLFPKENQIKGSAAMVPKDVFGFSRLDKVFTVTYQLGEDEVIAYISKRKSSIKARALVNGLYSYYKDFGAKDIKTDIPVKGALMIQIMGTYDVMFSINDYFAGVHEAPTQKQAEKLTQMLEQKLTLSTGGE